MKIPFLTVISSLAIAASSQAALLTSFSDDFNRADGPIGSNYTVGRGPEWIIVNNVATITNPGDSYTYLNIGTLPTTSDYTAGYSFTASFDFLLTGDAVTNTPVVQLLLNYQDVFNFSGIDYRGQDNRLLRGTERVSNAMDNFALTSTLPVNYGDWYTIGVSSTSVGNYAWTFTDRNTSTLVASGTWVPGDHDFATFNGGFLALGADGTGFTYYVDNLSVTVSAVPEPSAAVLMGAGIVGMLGVRRLVRSRA